MIVKTLCRALAAATLLAATGADAALIRFSFSGRVTDEAINGCGSLVTCGAVTGSFSFDSLAADGNATGDLGLYAASTISFSIDGTEFFTAANGVINVAELAAVDQYGLLATGTAGVSAAELSMLLQDFSATAFSSDGLPLTTLALQTMLPGSFRLDGGNDFELLGSIDSIACTSGCGVGQVPEPATSLLLAASLAAIGWSRRRKCT